jgi:nucleotide-binding universal stress UspA family protein
MLFVDLQRGAEPPEAVHELSTIAGALGASITLFDVIPAASNRSITQFPGRTRNRRHAGDRRAEAVIARFSVWSDRIDAAVDVSASVGRGGWLAATTAEIRTGAYDLVVVSSAGAGTAVRRIRQLLRTCEAPLLVVRDAVTSSDVVAEVHFPDRLGLNTRIIAHATAVAEALGVNVSYVCPLDPGVRHEQSIDSVQTDLTDLVPRSNSERLPEILIRPGRALSHFAERLDPHGGGLVVIGGSGRLRASKRLTGNAVEKLLATTTRSVLIVDPTAAKASRRTTSEPGPA